MAFPTLTWVSWPHIAWKTTGSFYYRGAAFFVQLWNCAGFERYSVKPWHTGPGKETSKLSRHNPSLSHLVQRCCSLLTGLELELIFIEWRCWSSWIALLSSPAACALFSKAGDFSATCLAVPRAPADGGSDGEGAAGTRKQVMKYCTNPS